MYMMNVDHYNAVKGGAASMQGQGGERKDPDDVAILKKHDAYVRNLNQEKIKEDKKILPRPTGLHKKKHATIF